MTTLKQGSFAGGELAPSLYARTDQVKYTTGLRTCRNMVVLRHGGVSNRPGTQFIAEVKDSSKKVRLIPFVFNADQTYVLEFGNLYMRVIRQGVQLGAPYEIATPYVEADLPTLQYVQQGDVITIVHPNYAPRTLTRTGHTAWTLALITFAPGQDPPTNVAIAGGAGALQYTYHVTAVSATGEESLAATKTQAGLDLPTVTSHTITWTAPAAGGAVSYNVYQVVSGVPSYVGQAIGTTFFYDGLVAPDTLDTPPVARNPFSGAGNWPSTVMFYQQRLVLANTDNNPETVYMSRIGHHYNFTVSSPLQQDDAVTFLMASRQVNEVRSLLDLGALIVLTAGGEWAVKGDSSGAITPTEINARQHSYNGGAELMPIIVDATALYIQARSTIVRDIGFEVATDGYRGNDLAIFAAHLFEGFTLTDWAYQQIPQSVVWAVRSDGTLLGLTYVREHQVWGWHRHDTLGTYENVVVVPEGGEDVPYVVVNRTIDGNTVRYIERFFTRVVDEDAIEDSVFMDSVLSFDGTNDTATTMTLSGGPPWTRGNTFTLTASAPFFVAGDVGNAIHLWVGDDVLRCEITAYTSTTIVTVRPHKDVPATMQGVALTTWGKAVDTFTGLDHLEAEDIAAFADGFVTANPNNNAYTTKTVASGSVTLDRPYVVVHIGLPYISDVETLDIDTPESGALVDKNKNITELTMFVEKTRGVWAGAAPPSDDDDDPKEGLYELKVRNLEGYDDPVDLKTERVQITLQSEWNSNGRVFMRQLDPLPITILDTAPGGYVPLGR